MAERTKPISSIAIVGATAIVVVLLILALAFAFFVGRTSSAIPEIDLTPETPIEKVGPVAIESIHDLSELTTVEAVAYTTVEKGTDRGWLDWATGDAIQMFAVAEIGAGVDLGQVAEGDVETDLDAGSIRIQLPPAAVTYVAVDNEATHVYNRDTGIFTRGDPNLERSARLAAEEVLVEQTIANGLLDDAEASAVNVLTEFFEALGFTEVEVITAPR